MIYPVIVQMLCCVLPCPEPCDWQVANQSIVGHLPDYDKYGRLTGDSSEEESIPIFSDTGDRIHESNNVKRNVEDLSPTVTTLAGRLRGFTMTTIGGKTYSAFQGIPFAEPPIGALRFQPPVAKSHWTGTRDAIAASPTCIQNDYIQYYKMEGVEDCLHLNIYTRRQLPGPGVPHQNGSAVMVFIHGGGFFFGSSNLYGPNYFMDQDDDIIFVSINYRLGVFGFFSLMDLEAPGNYGLKDQTMALQWVHDNIASFGGDPNRVTIFGESAGAGSVHFHMLSPLSRGLFQQGISESGCAFCFWSIIENAAEVGRKVGKNICGTENSTEIMSCLRNLNATELDTLARSPLGFLEWSIYPVVVFGPVVEPSHPGAFLDDLPVNIYKRGLAASVPWITGYNSEEGALNIATVFFDNKTKVEINTDWERIGPIMLNLPPTAQNATPLGETIREHYLGQQNITFETRNDSVKMFTDRYLVVCGVDAIRTHAKYTGQNVYAYYMNYVGNYSVVQKVGGKSSDWGASHLDELIYLMNNTLYYSALNTTDIDYQFSQILVNLWTNFAKNGEPGLSLPNGDVIHIWNPVGNGTGPMEYLELNLDPRMIPDPYTDRIQFWNDLPLDDIGSL